MSGIVNRVECWRRNADRWKDIDDYLSTDEPRAPHTPLEKLVMKAVLVLDCLLISQILKCQMYRGDTCLDPAHGYRHKRRSFVEGYALLMSVFLCFFLQMPGYFRGIAAVISVYVIAEVFIATLKVHTVHTYDHGNRPKSPNRSILLLLLGLVETILGFAVIYMWSQGIGASEKTGSTPTLNPLDFVYFSTVTAATVGYGDLAPISALGKCLVVAQIGITFVMVVFLLARFVGMAASGCHKHSDEAKQVARASATPKVGDS